MKNVSLQAMRNSEIMHMSDGETGRSLKKGLRFMVTFCSVLLLSVVANAQISGTIFRDLNGNGSKEGTEPGFAGIVVNTYNSSNALVASVTSPATGVYSVACDAGQNRVEFIIPPALSSYFPSRGGAVFGSNVQFVACNTSNINFGLSAPNDYCQSSPFMASPTYLSSPGDIGVNSISTVPIGASGTGAPGKVDLNSPYDIIGSVWGTAQQRTTNQLFTAAFMKRHAAFGAAGTGAIYVTTNTNSPGSSATQLYVDLQTLGINTGPNVHETGNLPNDANNANGSPYDAVGKVSFGDLDISQDGKYLFVTNLYENTIHRIFIDNPAKAPGTITAADVTTWDIPNPCNSTGEYHPWGLGIFEGKVYVGVICDASGSGNFNDLSATVYQMNPNTASGNFTDVLNFPLNYTRGTLSGAGGLTHWVGWQSSWTVPVGGAVDGVIIPQPILSDLEFDVDGTMIIGFMDRFGHQARNNGPDDLGSGSFSPRGGGDNLKAGRCGGGYTWTLENNASVCGGPSTAGAGNGQGPGNGEFYFDDDYNNYHNEISQGGLTLVPGSNQVILGGLDPFNIFTAGFYYLNNTTGATDQKYELVPSTSFGKAAALGDIEPLCFSAPIEIGNRVWTDTNKNGVQDPGEAGINGLTVQLLLNGNVVGTTTTAGDGNYYFTSANVPGGILYDTTYQIRIPNIDGGSQQAQLFGKLLTTNDIGTNDLNDSDGQASGTYAYVDIYSGNSGENNYDYDFGFFIGKPDIKVVKSVVNNPSPAKKGGQGKYTIVVSNNGEVDAASGLQIEDLIPAGATYVSHLPAGAIYNSISGIWNIGTLAKGASVSLDIVVTYNVVGNYYNTAIVKQLGNGPDLDPSNDTSRVCTSIPVNICGTTYTASLPGTLANYGSIQWYKDFLPLAGQTGLTLTINDDNITGVGAYYAEITRPAGDTCPVETCCPVLIEKQCMDLALTKVLASGQTALMPGDDVTFTITVMNQGDIAADSIQISDYIPTGMTLNDTDWNSVSATVANKLLYKNNGLPSAGLLPNQSATVDITLKIDAGFSGDSLVNFAEISAFKDTVSSDPIEPLDIDSTPDGSNANDDGGRPTGANDNYVGGNGKAVGGAPGDNNLPTDEDDHDPAVVKLEQIMDLALYKILADGQPSIVRGGDTVNFKITVVNQGTIAANNIVVTDYIPTGFSLVSGQGWSAGPLSTKTLTAGSGLSAGGLLPKDSVNIFIKLKVNTPVASGTKLINLAEISAMTDINGTNRPDIDSDPDNNPTNDTYIVDNEILGDAKTKGEDEDDHDPAEVVVNPFDLALYKVLAPGQPELVAPGDTVTFKITVLNQGLIPADNIQITDYIPSGMTYVSSGWTIVSGTEVNRTIVAGAGLPVGGLLPGDSASTTIKTRVNAPYVNGTSLQNFAEISNATDERGDPQIDIDSDPDNNPGNDTYLVDNEVAGDGKNSGDEDDHDPASVKLKKFDLALFKQLIGNQLVAPGDTVAFKITVVNQGAIDAANIQGTDYIPSDMTLLLPQAGWLDASGSNCESLPYLVCWLLVNLLQ